MSAPRTRSATLLAAMLLATGCANLPGVYKRPAAVPSADATPTAPGASAAPLVAPAVAAVGQLAPDLAFLDAGGQRHLLSEYKGKFLALVFFAHW